MLQNGGHTLSSMSASSAYTVITMLCGCAAVAVVEILTILRLPQQDGILVGAVGAYDWNGAVLKETRQGKVVPPKSSYTQEFPEELKNHGAYLGE